MKYLCFLISAFALILGACERHSWEDVKDADGNVTEKGTKNLYETHDAGGAGHEGDHEADQGAHEGDKADHEGEGAEKHEGADADEHEEDAEKKADEHGGGSEH